DYLHYLDIDIGLTPAILAIPMPSMETVSPGSPEALADLLGISYKDADAGGVSFGDHGVRGPGQQVTTTDNSTNVLVTAQRHHG
ncbi:hypothetical protein Q0P46_13990, partial [Staphylococcus aureus]|nr:hypothetical protein [Staphylococcus aureus]